MKRVSIALLAILMVLGGCLLAIAAGPNLTTVNPPNPADQVVKYNLFFDGAVTPVDGVLVNGVLEYNLQGVSEGPHAVKGQACNMWGCSGDSAPLSFTKKIPEVPVLKIVAP